MKIPSFSHLRAVACLAACAFVTPLAAQIVLPVEYDFEPADGYAVGDPPAPFAVDGIVAVSDLDAFSGIQSVLFTPGDDAPGLSLLFDETVTGAVRFVDFFLRPALMSADSLPSDADPGVTALTAVVGEPTDTAGTVFATDGSGEGPAVWTDTQWSVPAADGVVTQWIRFTYRLDYGAGTWDLFIDDEMILADLGFLDPAATGLTSFRLRGSSDQPVWFDYFYAGPANPLFADAGSDGLPDDWLIAHGLDPNLSQRYEDWDLDGLSNLDEYRLGTNPTHPDSDGDGVDDGLEQLLGLNPLLADAPALGTVPFGEGFETDIPGPFADGTRLWSVGGVGAGIVSEPDAPEGAQYLRANPDGDGPLTLARLFGDPQNHETVWIDLRLKVGYRHDATAPETAAPRAASAFYFGPDGRLRVLDGNGQGGGQWLALDHPPVEEGNWARLSVRHDYAAQRWSVWIDDIRRAQGLGFRDAVPAFNHIHIEKLNALDDLGVTSAEPAALDNDGDGLINSQELALGTDPEATDSSGDGWSDYEIYTSGQDPAQSYLSALPFVETFSGHAAGALVPGTNHWFAFDAATPQIETASEYEGGRAMRLPAATEVANHIDGGGHPAVWTDIVMRPVVLPDPPTPGIGAEGAVLFHFDGDGNVYAYDGAAGQWRYRVLDGDFDPQALRRITLKQDFSAQLWDLWIDGAPVFQGLGFAQPATHYERFVLRATAGTDLLIDSLRVSATPPQLETDSGLIGHWPLNGDAFDYSGNAYHGSLLPGADFTPNPAGPGRVLQAALGDAGTGHVLVGLPGDRHPGNGQADFTASGSVWVMFDDRAGMAHAPGWNAVLGHPPGLTYLSRRMDNDQIGTMVESVENGHPSSQNFWPRTQAGTVGQEGLWYHIAWTFDAHHAGEEGHFRWYVNGVLDAEYTAGVQANGTHTFRIGADYSARAANTKLAGVRLYERVLAPAEIAALYQSGRVLRSPGDPIPGDFPQDWIDQYFPGQTEVDPDADPDADGLTNWDEYLFGSDPRYADADNDGLDDAAEQALGTDPNHADSDGDGHPDGTEAAAATDPLDPASHDTALATAPLALAYHFNSGEGFQNGEPLPADFRLEYGEVSTGGPSAPGSKWRSLRFSKTEPTLLRFTAPAAAAGKPVLALTYASAAEALAPADLAARPIVNATVQTAFVAEGDGSTARLHVRDANGWQPLDHTAPVIASGGNAGMLDAWPEITLLFDFDRRETAVFADGDLLAAALPFIDPGAPAFGGYAWATSGTARAAIDHLRLSPDLVGTRAWSWHTGDRLPIGWKLAHGYAWDAPLDPASDPDGDGRSLYEEMLRGSDPHTADDPAPAQGLLHQVWTDAQIASTAGFDFVGATPPAEDRYHTGPLLFNAPFDQEADGADYGRRLRGYLTPTETGWYTLAGVWDHSGEVWLSPSANPFAKRRIAYSESWLFDEDWERWAGQRSLPVYLEAGESYYLEILGRGVVYNELYGLRWQHEDWAAPVIVPASVLTPYTYDFTGDTDGDGLPDTAEAAAGLDPDSPWGADGAYGDPDGDGANNFTELARLGGDPLVAESFPAPALDEVFNLDGRSVSGLPSPWQSGTLGTPSSNGLAVAVDAAFTPQTFAIIAEGANFAYGSESFNYINWKGDHGHMVSRPVNKPFRLSAKVAFAAAPDGSSVAGLTVAAPGLNDKDVRSSVLLAADGRIVFSSRKTSDGQAGGLDPHRAGTSFEEVWLRIERKADGTVTAYRSIDGLAWTPYASDVVALPESVEVGFVVSSQSPFMFAGAIFSEVDLELDSDGDGLYDREEMILGTVAGQADSDGDGVSDWDELYFYSSNPNASDIGEEVLLSEYDFATASAVIGDWDIDAGSAVNRSLRGAVELPFEVADPGAYVLELTFRPDNTPKSPTTYSFGFTLDGIEIGTVSVRVDADRQYTARIITPWVGGGSHLLGVAFENFDKSNRVRLQTLRVKEVLGPDADGNGRPDWLDHRLAILNGFDSETLWTSVVSPACVEGRARFFDLVETGDESINVIPAPGDRWFVNVPLNTENPMNLDFSFENGAISDQLSVEWSRTNVFSTEALTIRSGDSLLLEALPEGSVGGSAFIQAGTADPVEVEADSAVVFTFPESGTYVVTASWTDGAETLDSTLEVTVRAGNFGHSPVALIGQPREWENPALPGFATVEYDDRMGFLEVPAQGPGRSFLLNIDTLGARYVLARLPENDLILDQQTIRGALVASSQATGLQLLETYEDGSQLFELGIVVSDLHPEMTIALEIIVGGVVFDDGSILKILTIDDFDEAGYATVRFIRPASVQTSICHRTHVLDSGTSIGFAQ